MGRKVDSVARTVILRDVGPVRIQRVSAESYSVRQANERPVYYDGDEVRRLLEYLSPETVAHG